MFSLETVNAFSSYGTVALILFSFGTLLALLIPGITPKFKERFHAQHGLWVAFFFALFASVMTLYYSEVLGQAPCSLCWVQRVFLYPQVVLFFIAAVRKDRGIALYSIALSLIGAVVALYHHWLQIGGSAFFPCPASGNHIDCAEPTFITWGFVSFPFMAFALFVFMALFMLWLRDIWRRYPQA